MKKFMAAAVALGLLVSASANAQIEPMEVGVFNGFTLDSNIPMGPNATVFYDVTSGPLPDIKAYSFNINHSANGFVINEAFFGPGPLDVEGTDKNRAVIGTGGCIGAGAGAVLARFTFFSTTGADVDYAMCLTGDATSDTGMPEVAYCDDTIVAMAPAQNGAGGFPTGCGVINATGETPVANEASSFGGVKAGF